MAESQASAKQKTEGEATTQVRVRWDDSRMANTYANVCNVSSTREELTLLFGTNKSWHTGQPELTVELTNRIILNPYAAKRLSVMLSGVVKGYEARFGTLAVDAGPTGAPATAAAVAAAATQEPASQ